MHPPRMTIRRWMIAVAGLSVVFLFGLCSASDELSCHLCHNRKHVDSTLVCGLPVEWRGRIATEFPTAPAHRHAWQCYSRRMQWLLGPTSRDCRMRIYADGNTAPDGRR